MPSGDCKLLISKPVRRREDGRLLTGAGRFADDFNLPRQVYAAFVRSPVAHGIINGIDLQAARAAPGVLGAYVGDDVRAGGFGPIPYLPLPGFLMDTPVAADRLPLAIGRVRHVGDPVAMVIADTPAQAANAAEQVVLDIEALAAVTDLAAATARGAPVLWPDAAENVSLRYHFGDTAAVDEAFARAAHVTRLKLLNQRIVANPIEPRSCLAWYDAEQQRFELIAATQGVQFFMRALCEHTMRIPRARLHVRTYDVGGAFGCKEQPYPEDVCLLFAAEALGRPVKWRGSRGEHLLSDNHARDAVIDCALALDADGNFLAIRAEILDGMGAYYSCHGPFGSIRNTTNGLPLVYTTPQIDIAIKLVMANTPPTGPYRGNGREQAAYIVERLVDEAARETGRDRIALRRRNFIAASAMPCRTPAGRRYDSGEFAAVLDKALALAEWDGFAARAQRSAASGLIRGQGVSCFLECVGGIPFESAEVRFPQGGGVAIVVATQSQGQGHETSFAQVVADRLGVDMAGVRLCQGDSADVPRGLATVASRSMIMAGSAIALSCDAAIEKGRRWASHLLEAAMSDIAFDAGIFRVVGTDREVSLLAVAAAARDGAAMLPDLPPALDSRGDFDIDELFFPNGAHICEVEIDPQTGSIRVDRYAAVDDVGTIVNPLIVHGQVHGGVAQGIGQALMEHCQYDADGQLLTGSLLDYCLPRAADLPSFAVDFHPVPTARNPLGVKGSGEVGVTGSIPAVMNAVADALARAGAWTPIDMPVTSEKIWRALREKRLGG